MANSSRGIRNKEQKIRNEEGNTLTAKKKEREVPGIKKPHRNKSMGFNEYGTYLLSRAAAQYHRP
jgi:hypothetical protein